MFRLRRLLKLDGQDLYDELQGRRWGLVDFLAASRSYMSHLPAWKFWPQALIKWRTFHQHQLQDEQRS